MNSLIKTMAVLMLALASFVYGAATVTYEIFPFPVLKYARDSVSRPGSVSGDLNKGRELYDSLCAQCHARDGSGGEGPNLNRPVLTRAPDDEALRTIIREGVAAMPPVRATTWDEQSDIIAYVRTLGRVEAANVQGNPEKGKELYDKSLCSSCHIINGAGTGVGPELTKIGLARSEAHLREALLVPESSLPKGMLDVSRGFLEFMPVKLHLKDGRTVDGIRVNEDSFTIQIRDESNNFQSFHKSEIRELEKHPARSIMPSYRDEFSDGELDDLIAYLSSLRG